MKNENESTALALTFEKCREITNCPAGVDLQDHLRQLAAENVGLKAAIDGVHHELYGQGFMVAGWHLNGDLHPLDSWFEENDWNPENPATDRIYAGIKADGVEQLTDRLQQHLDDGDFSANEVGVIAGAIHCGREMAQQLRGVAK